MDRPSRWDKPLQFASAVTALNRGGIQEVDAAYNRQTRVSQPSSPPPAHLYSQQQQPPHGFHHDQNTNYFAGHLASPFQTSATYSPPPQQGPPLQQAYSPSSHSNSHSNSQSQSQSQSQPRYNSNSNQGQSPSPLGIHMNQGSTYGGGTYTEPIADHPFTASALSPQCQGSFDSGHAVAEGYINYDNAHHGHNSLHSQHQYSPQRSATQEPATYNNQHGQSYETTSTYNSSPSTPFGFGPRSYTVPVGHDCNQFWNGILDRCTICRPIG